MGRGRGAGDPTHEQGDDEGAVERCSGGKHGTERPRQLPVGQTISGRRPEEREGAEGEGRICVDFNLNRRERNLQR